MRLGDEGVRLAAAGAGGEICRRERPCDLRALLVRHLSAGPVGPVVAGTDYEVIGGAARMLGPCATK